MSKEHMFDVGENVLCQHRGQWYEGKCMKVDSEGQIAKYYVHYCGFNKSHDEWVSESECRIVKRTVDNVETMKELKEGAKYKKRRIKTEAVDQETVNEENNELVATMPIVEAENTDVTEQKKSRPNQVAEANSDPASEIAVAGCSGWNNPHVKKPRNGASNIVNGSQMATMPQSEKKQARYVSSEGEPSNSHVSSMLKNEDTGTGRRLRSSVPLNGSSGSGTSHAASNIIHGHRNLRSSSFWPPNESSVSGASPGSSCVNMEEESSNANRRGRGLPHSSLPSNPGSVSGRSSASSGIILQNQHVHFSREPRSNPIRVDVTDEGRDVLVKVRIEKCIINDNFRLDIEGFVRPVPPAESVDGDYTHYFRAFCGNRA